MQKVPEMQAYGGQDTRGPYDAKGYARQGYRECGHLE